MAVAEEVVAEVAAVAAVALPLRSHPLLCSCDRRAAFCNTVQKRM